MATESSKTPSKVPAKAGLSSLAADGEEVESELVHENPGDGTYGGRKAYAEQALPAEFDPAVPAPAKPLSEHVGAVVVKAREKAENYLFVKEQFFNGVGSSKRKTLTELHTERDQGYKADEVTHFDATAEDIVLEILHRAGIEHDHPELVLPF